MLPRTAVWLSIVSVTALASDNTQIFTAQILPVLQKHCAACHAGSAPQSNLSVMSYAALLAGGKRGPSLVPGSSRDSALMWYVRGEKTPRMPLGGELPPDVIQQLGKAIDAMKPVETAPAGTANSAGRDDHLQWLLAPPKAPALPAVAGDWVRNPIDAFILAGLDAKNMTPAPAAGRRTLIRRVYFDLIGLPPRPEEVRSFLNDPDPAAYEKLVDKLLADPRYGIRWARHWLDLARYAESDGFAVDSERPAAWRYRDYVIRAFNEDKPYDLFVKEQIAGDEVRDKRLKDENRPERLVALGFLRMATWEADATSRQQLRQDFLNEVTSTTASVFLGLTAGCAQCHNHKYDPIPQRDFYRLQAFFAATGVNETAAPFMEAEDPKRMKRLHRQYEDDAEAAKEQLDKRKEEIKQRFIESKKLKPDDPAVAEFMRELNVANAFFQEREDAIFKEQVWKNYIGAKDRLQKLTELERRYRPVAYGVTDIVPPNVPALPATHVLDAGELDAKGETVEPGFPTCVTGKEEPAKIPFSGGSSGRRLALAEWIADPKNPFTARVMVNRIWQYHFGEGLVRTTSDFGKNGSRASHRELLDWLASQFVERKWSIKDMHRLMLTSNTYRQSTEHPEATKYAEIDPGNQLLWRMNWMRLEAEVVRDSLLSLSGRLNEIQGGPGALLDVPDDMAEGFEFFKWFPSDEPEQLRRTIYTFQRRSVVDPMLEVFDVANANSSCSRRSSTTVAPQALTLLNAELPNTEARHFAARVAEEVPSDSQEQIEHAFWLALSRAPSDSEKVRARQLLRQYSEKKGLAHLGLVLFNLNEFLYLE